MEHAAPIVVATGPQLAGKTTLLTALVDFTPPWYGRIYTRGGEEGFSFLPQTDPEWTYILIPELSDHTPAYLWGERVRTLFEALDRGYPMAATIHAGAPDQVVAMLAAPPVEVPVSLLHRAGVIANLQLTHGDRAMVRRLRQLTVVTPGPLRRWWGNLTKMAIPWSSWTRWPTGLPPSRASLPAASLRPSQPTRRRSRSGLSRARSVSTPSKLRVAGYYAAGPELSQP